MTFIITIHGVGSNGDFSKINKKSQIICYSMLIFTFCLKKGDSEKVKGKAHNIFFYKFQTIFLNVLQNRMSVII